MRFGPEISRMLRCIGVTIRFFILTCGYIDADSDGNWYATSIISLRGEVTASSLALVRAKGITLCAAIHNLPGSPLPGLRAACCFSQQPIETHCLMSASADASGLR
jgi:hypothetical protein